MVATDTLTSVIQDLVKKINATDTNVTAIFDNTDTRMVLTAKFPGAPGGNVTYSGDGIVRRDDSRQCGRNNSQYLSGKPGADRARNAGCRSLGLTSAIHPVRPISRQTYLPLTMNNCALYMDGVKSPLLYVSPTQINAELPVEFSDRTSVSLYLRVTHADGSVTATTPIAITVVPQNPGLFALAWKRSAAGHFIPRLIAGFRHRGSERHPQTGDIAVLQIGPGRPITRRER